MQDICVDVTEKEIMASKCIWIYTITRKGAVDGNHHSTHDSQVMWTQAPPSEVKNNLQIEMHWFNIDLIKY
jgi:hypothetical protein